MTRAGLAPARECARAQAAEEKAAQVLEAAERAAAERAAADKAAKEKAAKEGTPYLQQMNQLRERIGELEEAAAAAAPPPPPQPKAPSLATKTTQTADGIITNTHVDGIGRGGLTAPKGTAGASSRADSTTQFSPLSPVEHFESHRCSRRPALPCRRGGGCDHPSTAAGAGAHRRLAAPRLSRNDTRADAGADAPPRVPTDADALPGHAAADTKLSGAEQRAERQPRLA